MGNNTETPLLLKKKLASMQNRPVAKVKVGSVEVAVWENKSLNKLYWNSVTIQRHY